MTKREELDCKIREVFERELHGRASLARLAEVCGTMGVWDWARLQGSGIEMREWDADDVEVPPLAGEEEDADSQGVFLVREALGVEDAVHEIPYAIPSLCLDEWNHREWVRQDVATREDCIAYAHAVAARIERRKREVMAMTAMMLTKFGKAPRVQFPDDSELLDR